MQTPALRVRLPGQLVQTVALLQFAQAEGQLTQVPLER